MHVILNASVARILHTGSVGVNSRGYFMRRGRNISTWVSNENTERERDEEDPQRRLDNSILPFHYRVSLRSINLGSRSYARNNDWAQFACETSHYIPPLYLVRPRPRVKTSKRLSTLILDLSFLFF